MEFLSQSWPWYVAGPGIALTLFLMLYFGKSFGVSSNLRTICAATGAGKSCDFFKFEWKKEVWNLVFVLGAVIGGFIAANFLTGDTSVALNPDTISDLAAVGFSSAGSDYLPDEIFGKAGLTSLKGILVLILGGFMVGFGARYAGGCTSGHAITGLSNLQIPSLISVIGFFIGGLIMTFFLLPLIF